jgi:hypothetical protein
MATLAQRARRINEPVSVPVKQHDFFPKAFVWRGQRHDVHAVEDCRTEVRRGWQGQVERHYFRVRAEDSLFELTQDLARDTWQLERVWHDE